LYLLLLNCFQWILSHLKIYISPAGSFPISTIVLWSNLYHYELSESIIKVW
jgi:hypothetical protein